MSGIFISYRRHDSAPYAGRLGDRLCESFGPDKVFIDVDDIEPGADFASLIEQKVASCDALIAVIGKNWLASDESGKSRIHDPRDFVRLELELALRRNILVVPALVEGASMPSAVDLPPELAEFAQRQAVEFSDRDFNRGFEKLFAALKTVPALTGANADGDQRTKDHAASERPRIIRNLATASLVIFLVIGFYWFSVGRSTRAVSVGGKWRGAVTYSWGDSYNENFRFEPEGPRLLGTASFLGYNRTIEDGRIERNQIVFRIRFNEASGGSTSTHINRYTGRVAENSIEFVVDDDRGNPPVRFTAVRAE